MTEVRSAINGKALSIAELPEEQGTFTDEIVMGRDGRVIYTGGFDPDHKDRGGLFYYAGVPARSCFGGQSLNAELVVEYRWNISEQRWRQEGAHTRDDIQQDALPTQYTDHFTSRYTTGESTTLDGKATYRLVAGGWVNPGIIPIPGVPPEPPQSQELWIDAGTLLPVRWEVLDEHGSPIHWGLVFTVDPMPFQLPAPENLALICVVPDPR